MAETESLPAGWAHARLIPTYGIRGQEEQERRAVSCLLAVVHGVPQFGHALLAELGAPRAPAIRTFAEVRFPNAEGGTDIPDGAIVCERAGRRWTCLVEVKTGTARLRADQVERYLEIARVEGFDGVLTISNEITHTASESPVAVDGRRLRRVGLWHLSWWRILTEAVVCSRYRGVDDPDQAWVLRELIHYLSGEASGVCGVGDMGESWVAVREAAHEGMLRHADAGVRDVAERWEEFVEYLCLSLTQEVGRRVVSPRPRGQSREARIEQVAKTLAGEGVLSAPIRVPDAAGEITVRADLRSRRTSLSVDLAAPGEGRPRSRINWLLRQLSEARPELRVETWHRHARESVASTLEKAREGPEALLYRPDPSREPRSFTLTWTCAMGRKRGRAEGSFVRETREQTLAFYRELVQNLKPWQPRAPRVRERPEPPNEEQPSAPDLLPLTRADRLLEQVTGAAMPQRDGLDGVVAPEQLQ